MYWYDLAIWTLKCVAELGLMWVCISRRVRAGWMLGGYSFFTTLFLMLVAERAPVRYNQAAQVIGYGGALVMAAVFVLLLQQLMRRRWAYVPLCFAYTGLLLSQMICTFYRWHAGLNSLLARLEILSWLVAVILLTVGARAVPREGDRLLLAFLWRDLILGE